jgi:hypothetical protein
VLGYKTQTDVSCIAFLLKEEQSCATSSQC